MSAPHDWVVGKHRAKLTDEVCRQHEVDPHTAWVVGFHLACAIQDSEYNRAWPSAESLASEIGVSRRQVERSIAALTASGLFTTVDPVTDKCHYDRLSRRRTTLPGDKQAFIRSKGLRVFRACWTVSSPQSWDTAWKAEKKRLGRVRVHHENRSSGPGRTFRVVYTVAILNTLDRKVLAEVTGIGKSGLSKAISGFSGVISGTPKVSVASHNKYVKDEYTSNRTNYVSSLPGANGPHQPDEEKPGDSVNPDDLFSSSNRVKDDGSVTGETQNRSRRPSERLPRSEKEISTWSAMDMAKEFRDRYRDKYPAKPGEVGNVVELGKILAARRKQFNVDALVEYKTLELWLADEDDHRRNPHIAAWRKWLGSFQRFRHLVDEQICSAQSVYPVQSGGDTSSESLTQTWVRQQKASSW